MIRVMIYSFPPMRIQSFEPDIQTYVLTRDWLVVALPSKGKAIDIDHVDSL